MLINPCLYPLTHVIVPVGWGYCSLTRFSYDLDPCLDLLITDCGVHSNENHKYSIYANFEVATNKMLYDWGSRRIHWIISHLDYDHYSLMANFAIEQNIDVDMCYLPASYSIDLCREAIAHMIAFQVLVLQDARAAILPTYRVHLRCRGELLPQIFLKICRSKRFVAQGDVIPLSRSKEVNLHVIWPNTQIAKDLCKILISEVTELVKQFCKKRKDEKFCLRLFEEFKDSLMHALFSEVPAERPPNSYEMSIYKADVESTIKSLVKGLGGEKLAELYMVAYRNYRNISSIAYAILVSSLKDVCLSAYTCYPYYCPYCPYPHHIALRAELCRLSPLICMSTHSLVTYLADLDDSNIDQAMRYVKLHIPSALRTLALIAPHHGNSWHNSLRSTRPLITVLSRSNLFKGPQPGYLELSPITITTGYNTWISIGTR